MTLLLRMPDHDMVTSTGNAFLASKASAYALALPATTLIFAVLRRLEKPAIQDGPKALV